MWWEATSVDAVLLDPKIRDWVLLPIFMVMFMQGILRHFVTLMLQDDKKVTLQQVEQGELLRRSQRLRAHNQFIPAAAFRMRKAFFVQKAFQDKPKSDEEKAGGAEQDPKTMMDNMSGMMKQNMAMIIPNMVMFSWVTYFFSGFVLVKVPFPLTARFKDMLQRGIALKTLNPSYVSSQSWYFINLFGLRGLFSLILGANSATDDARMMEQQMNAGNAMAQPDPAKIYLAERNELEIVTHDWVVCDAEYRLLGRTAPPHRAQDRK